MAIFFPHKLEDCFQSLAFNNVTIVNVNIHQTHILPGEGLVGKGKNLLPTVGGAVGGTREIQDTSRIIVRKNDIKII